MLKCNSHSLCTGLTLPPCCRQRGALAVIDWWLRHGRAKQPPGGVANGGLLLAAPASSGPPPALLCASTLAGMLTMCARVAALGQGSRECMLGGP
jgi:hypothetical protein